MLIWLIDLDGKIENLALMRLSAFHKARGDTVRLKRREAYPELFEKPDRVYISCIFRWNRPAAMRLYKAYGNLAAIGGSGVSVSACLSTHIENTPPDYELYNAKRAIGFISRGCIRRCPWCIVPKKEGGLQRVSTAQEVVGCHKKALLLDNNFLALEDYQDDLRWLAKNKVAIDFNQGLDARLVTDEAARLLAKCCWSSEIRLALDSDGQKRAVGRAVKRLVKAGFVPHNICVYCLIGFDGIESDLDRLFYLRSLGVRVFPMGYRDLDTGKEPMTGWNKKIYKTYRRLICGMPFFNKAWDELKEKTNVL